MSGFQRITAGDAKALMEQGTLNVADIRDAMSYQAGHIRNAERVDNDNLADFIDSIQKDDPLLVCCYHGNSSQGAAQFFAGQGFSKVYSLDGGFELWKMAFPELTEAN
ncbi:MAG: thiosulfate sulfurtransferase GlpE [Oceanospirillaceae bacterium]|nr:thiosulfate sulfurtransferase GlpE [Oceanospirillaceae bacterium]|tara:strand:- start:5287 stop:5610 length:324 start_codon:yes stop_codon:yes gene_type:complete